MKSCLGCANLLTEFNWHKARQGKRHYICNICYKLKQQQHYQQDFKRRRERAKLGYSKKPYGTLSWARQTVASHKYRDKIKNRKNPCDISATRLLDLIQAPCTYCGDEFEIKTLDRVNNALGHAESNCIIACLTCNETRHDNFTCEEMLEIGKTIRTIKILRSKNERSAI